MSGSEPVDPPPSPRDLIDGLRRAMAAVEAHAGGVYLWDAESSVLRMAVLVGMPPDLLHAWHTVSPDAALPVPDAIRTGGLVWLPDSAVIARSYPRIALVLPYDVSIGSYPIGDRGGVHGALFVIGRSRHDPDVPEEGTLELDEAARELAGVLERCRERGTPMVPPKTPVVPDPPRDSLTPVAGFTEMVERLPQGLCALDTHGRFTVVSETASDHLGVPSGALVGRTPWAALPWLDDPAYEDRYRSTVFSRVPSNFVALRPPDRWLSFRLYPDDTGVTVVITPTEVDWTDAGTESGRDAPRSPTRAGFLYHVLHLASALTEAAGVTDVVRIVAEEIMPTVGASALALFGHDQRCQRLLLFGHQGFDPDFLELLDGNTSRARAPVARTTATGVPGFFRSAANLRSAYPDPDVHIQDGLEGWAFLPLVASGRTTGTCVLAFTEPHTFSVQERGVLTALGGLIAQALERARLYDFKLGLAHGLQDALLPRWTPEVQGLSVATRYLPGTDGMDIGGDFYDLVPLDGYAGAAIGDVQGHNVSAAALMGQIRTALLAYATTSGAEPGAVLRRVNQLLCLMDSELFASCLYLCLDPVTGRVRMANAGHPSPILADASGGRVLPAPDGLLLGIDSEADYAETEFTLHPGATLALYTDGLVESPGVDLEMAQQHLADRLAEASRRPIGEVVDELTREALSETHRRDDIALMVLRTQA
jgi:GAF domain-containing protein